MGNAHPQIFALSFWKKETQTQNTNCRIANTDIHRCEITQHHNCNLCFGHVDVIHSFVSELLTCFIVARRKWYMSVKGLGCKKKRHFKQRKTITHTNSSLSLSVSYTRQCKGNKHSSNGFFYPPARLRNDNQVLQPLPASTDSKPSGLNPSCFRYPSNAGRSSKMSENWHIPSVIIWLVPSINIWRWDRGF